MFLLGSHVKGTNEPMHVSILPSFSLTNKMNMLPLMRICVFKEFNPQLRPAQLSHHPVTTVV